MASSAKMVPVLQTSTGVEYRGEPRRTSGARYQRVTTWEHTQGLIQLSGHFGGFLFFGVVNRISFSSVLVMLSLTTVSVQFTVQLF